MKQIQASELILNRDGSIYHLHLKPEHIADTILLVGDPHRVEMVSNFFDSIEIKVQNREFITHTGYLNNKRLTVVSTGIGTDNIDIVINELDALTNIDLKERCPKHTLRKLNFIRIGTSGAIQKNIPVDSFVISKMAVGLDGVLSFYRDKEKVCNLKIEKAFIEHTKWDKTLASPYFVDSSDELYNLLHQDMISGITITAPGFYGPQGRTLRLPLAHPNLNTKIKSFIHDKQKITNYEMESSAIYGLTRLLGHNAVTVCAIIANRVTKEFSSNYQPVVNNLIGLTLERLTK